MPHRARRVVAVSCLTLLAVAGGYVAGSVSPADASEAVQGRPAPKICWHDEFSVWRCGGSDSSRAGSDYAPALSSAQIQDISVTIRPKQGRPITLFLPANTDAIFLQRAPIENMLLRYYEATRQRDPANRLRRELSTWYRTEAPR
jgi:hypothetical protein